MEPPSPRSRSERVLRPILEVWSNVCDMDKGTICEFGNASHHDSEVVVVESDTAEEVFEFKNSYRDIAAAVFVVIGRWGR